ncbi:MAG: carboxypeptidase regulatory-like domain-containing protein [Acidobacteriota bacterium]
MKVLSCFFCVFFFIPMASAQNSGIQGVVTDETGAIVPGVGITVTNLETGVARTAVTNDVGFYSVPLLKEGRYKIKAEMPGFTTQEVTIPLEVGQVLRRDFQLKIGEMTQVVEVSALGSLLQSKPMDVGQVMGERQIRELPLNGRNYLDLAKLAIGVLPARQLGRGHRAGPEGAFLAVGMHGAQNNVLLDGTDNSSRTSGGPLGFEYQAVKPSVDAVSEFKVITNNTSAEHGFRMGAKVIVSTKSGTNDFHGSLYEFHRNDVFSANNFFANRAGVDVPKYIRNQFGATFGGPIIGDKTFFFGSYQGTRIRQGQSFTSSVPSQEVREGNFANQPDSRRNIFDPLTLTGSGGGAIREQFPNNRIPAERINPIAQQLIALYPLPNIAGREHLPNNFFFTPTEANDADQYDFRVDHNFNDANRIFVRYSLRDQFIDRPGRLPFPAMGERGETVDLNGQNLATNYAATISPTMHNEFRFGWSWFPTLFDIPFTENLNAQFGIKGAPGDSFGDGLDHGYTLFRVSGFRALGPRGFWPNDNDLKVFNVADNVLWINGNHSIKFGGEYRQTEVFRLSSRHRRGRFIYNGVYTAEQPNKGSSRKNTGNGAADFLLGWANNTTFGMRSGEHIIAPYYGFFIQDDWKVTPKLTLNLGLRWELFDGPYYPNVEEQTVSKFTFTGEWPNVESVEFVFPEDDNDCGCDRDLNNFAPRLGIAYRLADKTVIRAGGGIYYGEADYISQESGRFVTGFPRTIEISTPQPRTETSLFLSQGFPAMPPTPSATTIPGGGIRVTSIPKFLPTMYSGQWFLDVQHTLPWDMLLTVGYNGTSTSHMAESLNINEPLTPHPTIRAFDRRRYKGVRAFNLFGNILNANYNALAVKMQKRYSQGLTFLSSFTWAHNIDHGSEALNQGEASSRVSPYDLTLERASANLDRRLAYTLALMYELPFGPGRRWLQSGPASWILGGWQVGGILSLLSGSPLNHSVSGCDQNNGGRCRGDLLRDPNLPADQRTIDRWFDTEFAVAQTPGTIGNAGRNLIMGPGRSNLDFTAMKNFYMPWENHRLQLRFEAFNFTNTPHFGQPNTTVGSETVGVITEAEQGRLIQFALKYLF